MLTLRYARQSRSIIHPPSVSAASTAVLSSVAADPPTPLPSIYSSSSTKVPLPASRQSDITNYFKQWFMSRKIPLYDRIFETLRSQDGSTADAALSRFNIGLSEEVVLEVLSYNRKDVLSCLKFFDWAGRQPGFFHTRATFTAIFRIISKAKLTDLMLDFLQNFSKSSYNGKKLYHNVLVVGYALAGKCEIALNVFGKMRFFGHDLDRVAYNVLLNSLVEEGHHDFAESMAKEIRIRGYEDPMTHSIIVKSLCMQNELERAEEYLRELVKTDMGELNARAISTFVSALCKNNQFERASMLIDEFKRLGSEVMQNVYGTWINELVKVGKMDDALQFLKDKKVADQYVPDLFRFNVLICRLLKENRLLDVYDLLVEMEKNGVLPNDVTMNAVLGFLCKVGMMDIAMGLYNSKAEIGLSVNGMAYNYLINTLLGEASAEESYKVLKNSLEEGYFPGERTLTIVANALCSEGKLDKMKELVKFLLDRKLVPTNFVFDKFVAAFCRANRVDEAYMLHDLLLSLNKTSQKYAYYNMIHGFCRSNRGDIATRLLIDMQERGFRPSRTLFRMALSCLLKMDNPEQRFFGLLEMQLSCNVFPPFVTFEIFIDGAGHADRPELAVLVYEVMRKHCLAPNLNSSVLLLQCYLKSRKLSNALTLFCDFCLKWQSRKLWHVMIVGLCRIREPDYASKLLHNMQKAGLTPSIQCYEELVKLYCDLGQYNNAVDLVNHITSIGRSISSFIGNVFLLHSLKSGLLYDSWASSSAMKHLTPTSWMLGHLIGIFSGCLEGYYQDEDVETLVQNCFETDVYTYNMMLKRLSTRRMDFADKVIQQMREKGYEPNRWTYDTIIHGLARQGRDAEARQWMKEMVLHGFDPVWQPRNYIMHE